MTREPEFSKEFLNAFVDDQLAPEDKDRVYQRLPRDEALSREVCELRKTRELVRFAYLLPPRPPRPRALPKGRAPIRRWGVAAVVVLGLATAVIGRGLYGHAATDRGDARLAIPSGYPSATTKTATEAKVLFQISDARTRRLRQALDEVEDLLRLYRSRGKTVRVEVVANGPGLRLLRADVSPFAKRIRRLQRQYPDLDFLACQNTIDELKRDQGIVARLLPGVRVTDSGVAQIMRRQHQGWAYIQV